MSSIMQNKKGLHWEQSVILIAIVAGAIMLMFVTREISDKTIDLNNRNACRESASIRHLATKIPEFSGANLACKTYKIEVETDDLDVIKKTIAEQMYLCYWQFGAGKFTLLEKNLVELKSGPFCYVCNEIIFKDHPAKKVGVDKVKEEIVKYLNEAYIPSSNITYSEYFLGPGSEFSIDQLDDTLFTSDSILINFEITKKIDFSDLKTYLAPLIGAGFIFVTKGAGGISGALAFGKGLLAVVGFENYNLDQVSILTVRTPQETKDTCKEVTYFNIYKHKID